MSYSPKEQRAIAWYAQTNDLRLALSSYPTIRFQKKTDNTFVEKNVAHLVQGYEVGLKESARERATQRRREKRRTRS